MTEHEKDCKWPNVIYISHITYNNRDDENLTIDCEGITYNPTVFSNVKPIERIDFKFCPLCGCSLT